MSEFKKIYTVREVTYAIKDILEGCFPVLRVRGQISNLSKPSSGHVYFSIKDEETSLNVVCFTQGANFNCSPPLHDSPARLSPGKLQNGQEVICSGRISIYPPRGQYQLIAEHIEDAGLGRLHIEFEALKRRLAGLGYFDAERKRPLPSCPVRIAVITAPTGAALQDFLRIAAERGPGEEIRIYPTLVQGQEAPAMIAEALQAACRHKFAEVIVLIRGGGSLEDLWSFNSELVVKAIYNSSLPVLTGIGHEIDLTLADMAADTRAATPTHAAQMLWPERQALFQRLDDLESALQEALTDYLEARQQKLSALEHIVKLFSPERMASRLTQNLENLSRRLELAWSNLERTCTHSCELLELKLHSLDPHLPLKRGYNLVFIPAKKRYLRSVQDVETGLALHIHASDGIVKAIVGKNATPEHKKTEQLKLIE